MLLPLWCLPLRFFCSAPFSAGCAFPWIHAGEEAFFSATAGLARHLARPRWVLGLIGLAGPGRSLSRRRYRVCWDLFFGVAGPDAGIRNSAGIPRPACLRIMPRVPPPAARSIFLPPFFYDTLHYHYGLPSIFLRSGHSVPLPYVVESYFPLAVEMLFMVGMSDGGYVGANLVNIFLLRSAASGSFALRTAWASAARGWRRFHCSCSPRRPMYTVFMQKIDLGVTLFFLPSSYSFLLYLDRGENLPVGGDRRFLVLSGRVRRPRPRHEIHHAHVRARHGACRICRTSPAQRATADGGHGEAGRSVLPAGCPRFPCGLPCGVCRMARPQHRFRGESGLSRPRGDFPFPGLVAGAVGPSFRRCPLYRVACCTPGATSRSSSGRSRFSRGFR